VQTVESNSMIFLSEVARRFILNGVAEWSVRRHAVLIPYQIGTLSSTKFYEDPSIFCYVNILFYNFKITIGEKKIRCLDYKERS
jgi:hypothetical protein